MQQTTAKEAALNIFAILGFIALLIAGLWSTIQLMQIIFGFVGSTKIGKSAFAPLASLSQPSVAIALADSNVTPNKPFAVGWSGNNVSNTGSLTFTYACREGLFLKVQASKDTEYAVPCNAPYAVPKDATNLSVTPVLSTPSKIDVPLTIAYTDNGKTTKDTASVTIDGTVKAPMTSGQITAIVQEPIAFETRTKTTKVIEAEVAAPVVVKAPVTPAPVAKLTPPAPTPTKPKPAAPKPVPVVVEKPVQKSNTNGYVDLYARIVTVGKLASNGTVSTRATFSTNETASVTFEVVNTGTKAVKNWVYSLSLPTNPAYTYTSDAQPTLYAGSKATVTISFDKLLPGTNALTLIADPTHLVTDTNRSNNSAQKMVTVK